MDANDEFLASLLQILPSFSGRHATADWPSPATAASLNDPAQNTATPFAFCICLPTDHWNIQPAVGAAHHDLLCVLTLCNKRIRDYRCSSLACSLVSRPTGGLLRHFRSSQLRSLLPKQGVKPTDESRGQVSEIVIYSFPILAFSAESKANNLVIHKNSRDCTTSTIDRA